MILTILLIGCFLSGSLAVARKLHDRKSKELVIFRTPTAAQLASMRRVKERYK
jgi:hypothetical protein